MSSARPPIPGYFNARRAARDNRDLLARAVRILNAWLDWMGVMRHETDVRRTQDQVVRQAEFSKDHPEVSFEFRYETGLWDATFPAGGNGTHTVRGYELRAVLDELEERLSSKRGQDAVPGAVAD